MRLLETHAFHRFDESKMEIADSVFLLAIDAAGALLANPI